MCIVTNENTQLKCKKLYEGKESPEKFFILKTNNYTYTCYEILNYFYCYMHYYLK